MKITFKESGKTLSLEVKGYEFPYNMDNDLYDNNWLNIGVSFRDGASKSDCVDPCLLTWEMGHISDGLEELLSGERDSFTDEDIWLLEPYIRFIIKRISDNRFSVMVGFMSGKIGSDKAIVNQIMSARELSRLNTAIKLGTRKFPAVYNCEETVRIENKEGK